MTDSGATDVTPVIYALQQEFELPDHVAQEAVQMVEQYRSQQPDMRSLDRLAAAALYLVARIHGEAPIPKAIAEQIGDESTLLLRRARDMATELGLDPKSILDATQYVTMIADELDLNEAIIEQAKLIVNHARDEGLASGKSPRGQAAAAVYAASCIQDKRLNQDTISDVIDVSEVTIRNRYREQLDADPPIYQSTLSDSMKSEGTRNRSDQEIEGEITPEFEGEGFVGPSPESLSVAIDIVAEDSGLKARAVELFELAQESPRCDFAMSDDVNEWLIAAVCIATEESQSPPTPEEKTMLAELVNLSPQQLEGRCYKLRRTRDQENS